MISDVNGINIAKHGFVAEFPAQPIDDPTDIAARHQRVGSL